MGNRDKVKVNERFLNPLPGCVAVWESESKTRDMVANWGSAVVSEEVTQEVIRPHLREGMQVVDLGCGPQRFAPFIKRQGAIYTGVDSSKNMSSLAVEENVVVHDDILTPVIPDYGTYDIALLLHVARHYEHPMCIVKRIMEQWKAKVYIFTILVCSGGEQNDQYTAEPIEEILPHPKLRQVTMTRFREEEPSLHLAHFVVENGWSPWVEG